MFNASQTREAIDQHLNASKQTRSRSKLTSVVVRSEVVNERDPLRSHEFGEVGVPAARPERVLSLQGVAEDIRDLLMTKMPSWRSETV